MKKLQRIILIVSLFILLIISTINVFYPSYLSVVNSCNLDYFNEVYGDRYYVSGQVSVSESEEVELYLEENYDLRTLKHEWIHIIQYSQNRLYGCNHIFLKYLNEVEAYSMSYLPNFLYRVLYPGLNS